MKGTQKYISAILKTLLMFSIVLLILDVFINCFVLNKNTYINTLSKNDTYAKITDTLYSKIDSILNEKSINIDIKKSLITEEDISREADTAITGLIDYLKTGKNNMVDIDSTVYKNRVSDILKSFIGGNNSLLSENVQCDNQGVNLSCNEVKDNNKLVYQNMIYVTNVGGNESNKIVVDKLATRSEIEAKIRKKLAEKGISEAQARQMLKDRGISEEQAWKMLAGYGIVPDEDKNQDQNNSSSEKKSSDNNSNDNQSTVTQSNNSQSDSTQNNNASQKNEKSNDSQLVAGKSDSSQALIQNQLNDIVNKLINDANSIIDKEIQKISLHNLVDTNKFKRIAQITSIFYAMRWVFLAIPIILVIILHLILKESYISIVKSISIGFIFTGVMLLLISLYGNIFNIYNKLGANASYLKDIISPVVKHFLSIILGFGTLSVVIGAILIISTKMHFKTNRSSLK